MLQEIELGEDVPRLDLLLGVAPVVEFEGVQVVDERPVRVAALDEWFSALGASTVVVDIFDCL